jgi:hypothetical protein
MRHYLYPVVVMRPVRRGCWLSFEKAELRELFAIVVVDCESGLAAKIFIVFGDHVQILVDMLASENLFKICFDAQRLKMRRRFVIAYYKLV